MRRPSSGQLAAFQWTPLSFAMRALCGCAALNQHVSSEVTSTDSICHSEAGGIRILCHAQWRHMARRPDWAIRRCRHI